MNHTITLQLIPRKYWLSLGPGWAVLGSVLASGVLRFEDNFWALNAVWLIKLGLLWLLVDPVLGTLWRLVVDQGVWRHLTVDNVPAGLPVKPLLPYTTQKSAGYRLSMLAALLRSQNDGQWQTSLILPFIALGLAAILGWPVILYSAMTLLLIFFIGGAAFKRKVILRLFCQSVISFLLPYAIGLILMNAPEHILLGMGYWVVAFGALLLSTGRATADRLIIVGQGAIALLLFALVKPIAAAVVSLAALFSLTLRLNITQHTASQNSEFTADGKAFSAAGNRQRITSASSVRSLRKVEESAVMQYAAQLRPFLLSGFLIAAISLGGIG